MEFWWEGQKGKGHYEDIDVGRRMILISALREIGYSSMEWTHLA
jgi:hypothetical protein